MRTLIDYKELSDLTKNQFTFERISEDTIKVIGHIKIFLITKKIQITLKITRIGNSSVDLLVSDPALVSIGFQFVPENLKAAIADFGQGKIKIDLRAIPELSNITKTFKLDDIKFEESELKIVISQRP